MNGYVVAGYLVILVSLALYAARVVLRTRTLARVVAADGDGASDAGGVAESA